MNQTADQLRLEATHCDRSSDDYLRSLAKLMEQAANEMDPLFDNRRREQVRRNATGSFWCPPQSYASDRVFDGVRPSSPARVEKLRQSWARHVERCKDKD